MKQKTFFAVSLAVFSIVGLLHTIRLIYGWEAIIDGYVIPVWFSVIGPLLIAPLAYFAYKFWRSSN